MKQQFQFDLEHEIGDTVVFEGEKYIVADSMKVSQYMGYKCLLKGLNKWVYQSLLTKNNHLKSNTNGNTIE